MKLRKANISDADLLFRWVNNKSVRENSINTQSVLWENHKKWLTAKLQDSNTHIYILEFNGNNAGQVRFDKVDNGFFIDYSISENFRRKGLGQKILDIGYKNLCKTVNKNATVFAKVKKSNLGSIKIFKKLNYIFYNEEKIEENEYLYFFKTNKPIKHLIVSEKSWNKNLVSELSFNFPSNHYVLINKKKFLNLKLLEQIKPEIIFFPHWSYLIKENIYNNYNCIVFHMTDLPFGRGGSPLQNLIERKLKKTKIAAIKVVKEIDAGGIYLKKDLDLYGTAEEIFLRANNLIKKMIIEIISWKLVPKDQIGKPTFFKRRTPEMSIINNSIENIKDVYDHIRMLDAEGYPKAFIETKFFKIEFSRASLKVDKTIIADVRIIKK